jgi:hypothetical protein
VIHLDEGMREECESEIKLCRRDWMSERERKKKFATAFI